MLSLCDKALYSGIQTRQEQLQQDVDEDSEGEEHTCGGNYSIYPKHSMREGRLFRSKSHTQMHCFNKTLVSYSFNFQSPFIENGPYVKLLDTTTTKKNKLKFLVL